MVYSHSIQLLHGTFLPGQYGVTAFFFISGFIITRLLLNQESINCKSFYIRRFFRLAPALFVYIAASITALGIIGYSIPIGDIVSVIFYNANYHFIFAHFAAFGPKSVHSPFTICWSLAVEEHFYLLFPLLLLALAKRIERLAWVLLAFCVAVLAWRAYLIFGVGDLPPNRIELGTDTRLDSIAFGCLLSTGLYLAERGNQFLEKVFDALHGYRGVVACGILLVASAGMQGADLKYVFGYSIQGVAFGTLFVSLFWRNPAAKLKSALQYPGLVYIGSISYSLYLYHYLSFVIAQLVLKDPVPQFLFTWTFGLAGALMSYYWVENVGRDRGRRYEASLQSGPL